ncbi:hypothetical protein ABT160_32810 [Streptomyces sp. NPDC001941]|uniref:hypothetical protein n=1 Tax=Streptomyces sp. NPDC001941 TaxID=3154659 RepID=UPI003330E961
MIPNGLSDIAALYARHFADPRTTGEDVFGMFGPAVDDAGESYEQQTALFYLKTHHRIDLTHLDEAVLSRIENDAKTIERILNTADLEVELPQLRSWLDDEPNEPLADPEARQVAAPAVLRPFATARALDTATAARRLTDEVTRFIDTVATDGTVSAWRVNALLLRAQAADHSRAA